jgi:hypothetical protein
MNDYQNTAVFEDRFWLQVLGDHARFIFNALAPDEQEEIQQANYFRNIFDQLLERSRQTLSGAELMALNQQAYQQAQGIRNFKLNLLRKQLVERLRVGLPPTFFNHMVNEVEESLWVFNALMAGQIPPPQNPLHYHLLWLLDAEGHAVALLDNLDNVERDLIERSNVFMNQFNDLYKKALELSGYQRTCLVEFPALARFNRQVDTQMIIFKEFLDLLEELVASKQALGTLTPLMPDHMAREECYYLTKLSQVAAVKKPECDPGEPRVEG